MTKPSLIGKFLASFFRGDEWRQCRLSQRICKWATTFDAQGFFYQDKNVKWKLKTCSYTFHVLFWSKYKNIMQKLNSIISNTLKKSAHLNPVINYRNTCLKLHVSSTNTHGLSSCNTCWTFSVLQIFFFKLLWGKWTFFGNCKFSNRISLDKWHMKSKLHGKKCHMEIITRKKFKGKANLILPYFTSWSSTFS